MKYTPKKVFIKENENYIEITNEEHERRKTTDEQYAKRKFISLQGYILEVDDRTALAYEQIDDETRREKERAHWRARKKLNSLEELTDLGVQFASGDLTPEQALIKNEDYRRLHNALSKLPDEQRELIIRVYFKNEKQADIAREQGVTRKAINNRLDRIYAQLKKIL